MRWVDLRRRGGRSSPVDLSGTRDEGAGAEAGTVWFWVSYLVFAEVVLQDWR